MGPSYNRFPEEIRVVSSTATFKHKIKKWLLQRIFYGVEDELPELTLNVLTPVMFALSNVFGDAVIIILYNDVYISICYTFY